MATLYPETKLEILEAILSVEDTFVIVDYSLISNNFEVIDIDSNHMDTIYGIKIDNYYVYLTFKNNFVTTKKFYIENEKAIIKSKKVAHRDNDLPFYLMYDNNQLRRSYWKINGQPARFNKDDPIEISYLKNEDNTMSSFHSYFMPFTSIILPPVEFENHLLPIDIDYLDNSIKDVCYFFKGHDVLFSEIKKMFPHINPQTREDFLYLSDLLSDGEKSLIEISLF